MIQEADEAIRVLGSSRMLTRQCDSEHFACNACAIPIGRGVHGAVFPVVHAALYILILIFPIHAKRERRLGDPTNERLTSLCRKAAVEALHSRIGGAVDAGRPAPRSRPSLVETVGFRRVAVRILRVGNNLSFDHEVTLNLRRNAKNSTCKPPNSRRATSGVTSDRCPETQLTDIDGRLRIDETFI